MAENKKHVIHIRSNQSGKNIQVTTREDKNISVTLPKVPKAEALEYGEIAINYGKGIEGFFIKNSDNKVVQLNDIQNLRYYGKVDSSLQEYLDDEYVNVSGDTIHGDITIKAKEGSDKEPNFRFEGDEFTVSAKTTNILGDNITLGDIFKIVIDENGNKKVVINGDLVINNGDIITDKDRGLDLGYWEDATSDDTTEETNP